MGLFDKLKAELKGSCRRIIELALLGVIASPAIGCGLVQIGPRSTDGSVDCTRLPTQAEASVCFDRRQARAEAEESSQAIDQLTGELQHGCPSSVLEDLFDKHPSSEVIAAYKKVRYDLGTDTREDRTRRAELRLDERMARLTELVTDCVELTPDKYQGNDRKQLAARFAEMGAVLSKRKVLRVVLRNAGWSREKGSTLVGDRLIEFDQAFMEAWVVVEKDETNATIWNVMARKDFLDDGAVKFDALYQPRAVSDIRVSKLK